LIHVYCKPKSPSQKLRVKIVSDTTFLLKDAAGASTMNYGKSFKTQLLARMSQVL